MDTYLIAPLIGVLFIGASQDAIRQKIPNLLTLPTILSAFLYHGIAGGLSGFIFSFNGFAIGFGLFLLVYVIGGLGAGDVKLMGAVGAILGPKAAIAAVLCTALAGLLYSFLLMMVHREFGRDFLSRFILFIKGLFFTRRIILIPAAENIYRPKLCYGIAIAAGTLASVWMEYTGYTLI